MAHLKLRAKPPKRNVDETHCNFVILGCSSTLDNEETEFDEDYDDSSGIEEHEKTSSTATIFSGGSGSVEKIGKIEELKVLGCGLGLDANTVSVAAEPDQVEYTNSSSASSTERYESEWIRQGQYGFATVFACKTSCVLSFFSVNIETGEYAKLYDVPMSK